MTGSKIKLLPPVQEGSEEYTLYDAMSCVVTENLNESFECQLTYPIYGENYNKIKISARIQCMPNPYEGYYTFMIYSISKPMGGVITAKAEHVSYQSAGSICRGGTDKSVGETAQEIIGYLTEEVTRSTEIGFLSFFTDIDDSIKSTFNYDKPTDGRQVMSDAAAMFGGMWKFTDHSAYLMANRGENRGFSVKYGVNAIDINNEEDVTARYTHICPFWIGNVTEIIIEGGNEIETTTEKQKYLSNKYIAIYGTDSYFRPYLYDCSKIFTDEPDDQELSSEAIRFALDPSNADLLGKRTKSMSIDYVALKKTSEYIDDQNYSAENDHVEIGDVVTVVDRYGETNRMICMATTYNVLKDRYDKIDVGYRQTAQQNIEAKPKQPRTQKTIAKIERELKKIETNFQAVNLPLRIEKISNNEVRATYASAEVTRTAEGTGNERHNFKRSAIDKDGKTLTEYNEFMSVEEAAAIMMSGGTGDNLHPDKLEYKDNDSEYTLPQGIVPAAGETFDTITETWIIDKTKQKKFSETATYYNGEYVVKDDVLYKCIKRHSGAWESEHFEKIEEESKSIWGIGVINKNTDLESINRMIYPNGTQISLINFNGEGGIG